MENRIIKDVAETMYINHETSSYAIFCYNSHGDLFVNGDWGYFTYAWRSFSGTFKEFLAGCNADYITGKLAINWNNIAPRGNRFVGNREKNVKILVQIFIDELKKEQAL